MLPATPDASVNVQAALRSLDERLATIEKTLADPTVSPEDLSGAVSAVRREIARATSLQAFRAWEEVFGGPDAVSRGGIKLMPLAGSHAYVIPEGDSLDPGVLRGALIEATDWAKPDRVRKFNLMGSLSVEGALLASKITAGSLVLVSSPVGLVELRGGTLWNPNGITAAANVIAWIAPYACTVTAVKGYRVGGTGATINARLNGASNHLASALSLTSADTWMDGGAVQNTAYAVGDKLEIMAVTVTGSPTQIGVAVYVGRT